MDVSCGVMCVCVQEWIQKKTSLVSGFNFLHVNSVELAKQY